MPQYAEGLPGLVEHPQDNKVSVNKQTDDLVDSMTAFYESALTARETGDYGYFKISEEYASGIAAALEAFSKRPAIPPYVKVQTTGPISFGLSLYDEEGIPILYDANYADIVLQNAILKSIWQIRLFKPFGGRVICFIDEPLLSSFGSSVYINLSREQVVSALSTAVQEIKEEGALVGVHVCGNSEWTLLLDAQVDIISFDAYHFGESLALYASRVREYLEKGGALAWGIVPTNADIREQSAASLEEKLNHFVNHLAGHGVDRDLIWEQTILTPSCGMGTMSVEDGELVIRTLGELVRRVQKKIR
jgi:methionine synthase II (cobalamin-independent)